MTATRYHSSAPSIGESLRGLRQGRHLQRTGVKVLNGSVDVDDERARRYVRPVDHDDDAEVAAYLQAIDRWNDENKKEGKYVGPLRSRGIAVVRWLLREARANGGVCSPSHEQIAREVKIGRRTVCRIMKELFLAGFVEWQRRSIEVEGEDGGVVREQTSNLYRFNLPQELAGMVKRLVSRATGRSAESPLRIPRIVATAELQLRPDLWTRTLGAGQRLAATLAQLAPSPLPMTLGAKLAHSSS